MKMRWSIMYNMAILKIRVFFQKILSQTTLLTCGIQSRTKEGCATLGRKEKDISRGS